MENKNKETEKNDTEQERIWEFEGALGQVGEIKTVDVNFYFENDDDPIENTTRRFINYEMSGIPKLYLAPQVYVPENEGQPDLSFKPRIARGGKRSNHGVFFGDLSVNGKNIPVAVKPHEIDGEESCLRDFYTNCAIEELGLYTLQPVGFLLTHKNEAYSMTRLDETLTTLDSVDWTHYYPTTRENPGMHNIWSQVARQLALLHSMGSIVHGDLAPRNIANSIDNNVYFIDWEKAAISLKKPRDVEISYGNSFQDLSVILESFCRPTDDEFKAGIAMFYGKNDFNWGEAFEEVLFDEYAATRIDFIKAQKGKKRGKLKDAKEEIQELRNSLGDLADVIQQNYLPEQQS